MFMFLLLIELNACLDGILATLTLFAQNAKLQKTEKSLEPIPHSNAFVTIPMVTMMTEQEDVPSEHVMIQVKIIMTTAGEQLQVEPCLMDVLKIALILMNHASVILLVIGKQQELELATVLMIQLTTGLKAQDLAHVTTLTPD